MKDITAKGITTFMTVRKTLERIADGSATEGISTEDVITYQCVVGIVNCKAQEILKRVSEVDRVRGSYHMELEYISGGTVYLHGVEDDRGGYEHYNYEFPLDLLFGEHHVEAYIKQLKDVKEAHKALEGITQKEKDLKELSRLQELYGENN